MKLDIGTPPSASLATVALEASSLAGASFLEVFPFIRSLCIEQLDAENDNSAASSRAPTNISKYLADLSVGGDDTIFSAQRRDLLLFDFNRASKNLVGGMSSATFFENNRLELAEIRTDPGTHNKSRFDVARADLSKLFHKFRRPISILPGGLIYDASDRATNDRERQAVGFIVTKNIEELFETAGLCRQIPTGGGSAQIIVADRFSHRQFTHFVPYLNARIPDLRGEDAVLLVSYIQNLDGRGAFAIEGQLVPVRFKGVSDDSV